MSQIITVGISDLNVAKDGDVLVTYALGSCVGICLYDTVTKVAGMSHIMLPSSQGYGATGDLLHKFADTALGRLIPKMMVKGANPRRLQAKIAGGAQMFGGGNSAIAGIGPRNVDAVKAELTRLRIPIVAEDTGKNYGRTQILSSADGSMRIRSATKGEWVY